MWLISIILFKALVSDFGNFLNLTLAQIFLLLQQLTRREKKSNDHGYSIFGVLMQNIMSFDAKYYGQTSHFTLFHFYTLWFYEGINKTRVVTLFCMFLALASHRKEGNDDLSFCNWVIIFIFFLWFDIVNLLFMVHLLLLMWLFVIKMNHINIIA